MATSHFSNSKASMGKFEVVNGAQFKCSLLPPFVIDPIVLEHIEGIDGLDALYPQVGIVEQKFMQSTRSFAGKPDTTAVDLTFTMSMNLNNAHENYVYNTIRRWYNMVFDPSTGAEGLKRDYCGSCTITQYDRDGSIWRIVNVKICFPTGAPSGLGTLNIGSGNEAQTVSFTLRCDLYAEGNKGLN